MRPELARLKSYSSRTPYNLRPACLVRLGTAEFQARLRHSHLCPHEAAAEVAVYRQTSLWDNRELN